MGVFGGNFVSLKHHFFEYQTFLQIPHWENKTETKNKALNPEKLIYVFNVL